MSPTTDTTLYHLVIDGAVHVFLGRDPREDDPNGPRSEPVTLELLPARHRFGGTCGVSVGRPVLGRRADGAPRFRQFVTIVELEQAGWVPVRHYRVCDDWNDYHDPWSSPAGDGSTA